MLLANYPGRGVAEVNVIAIAETFERMGMDIAPRVAERAQAELEHPPSSAELYTIAREVRLEVGENEWRASRPSLTAIEGVEMPEELRNKVNEMTDPLRKLKKREAETKLEGLEWEKTKARLKARPIMSGVCSGTDKLPIERDGKRFCPECGMELEDIEAVRVGRVDKRRRPRLV
jgi:hypothetical protein